MLLGQLKNAAAADQAMMHPAAVVSAVEMLGETTSIAEALDEGHTASG
jgi:hypothetical protein